ncbi:MAG: threonylcarbamoyl-AMP synthase [Acidobacteria bacterium]|nr:threonylcarbamoyl-AMP synthase [Acidobacteriota bacterium]
MASDTTKRVTQRLIASDTELAGSILRKGGTVAIPTETVYGLGANALSAAAVEQIFEAKGRPSWDPLIVHISNASMLSRVVQSVPENARKLMDAFWPGPLTLLLKKSEIVPDIVTAGRPLVGVRMPDHPVAQAIISAAGVPIAAPSANRFGHISPTRAEHVLADLDGRIDAVVDAGPCEVGVESTVLDVTQSPMVIYRPGAISLVQIEQVAGPVVMNSTPEEQGEPESLPSPGVGMRHYAPRARVMLVRDEEEMEHAVGNANVKAIGVLLPPRWSAPENVTVVWWESLADPAALAHTLFDRLRTLDAMNVDCIIVPLPVGQGELSAALEDRLRKAAWVR